MRINVMLTYMCLCKKASLNVLILQNLALHVGAPIKAYFLRVSKHRYYSIAVICSMQQQNYHTDGALCLYCSTCKPGVNLVILYFK